MITTIHCEANKGSHFVLTIISQQNTNQFSKTMGGLKRSVQDLQSEFCPVAVAQFSKKWQPFYRRTLILVRRKVSELRT